jgi:hypothetical protein
MLQLPEDRARGQIKQQLIAAGRVVQDAEALNLTAGLSAPAKRKRRENVTALKFTPRSYFNAAKEHLGYARQMLLQSQPQYFVAHYFAGIAVEDILRALSVKEKDSFDHSHSIEYWTKKANWMPAHSEAERDKFRAAMDEINTRWRANQRYFTEKMLDTYLASTQLDKIRGDRVKYGSQRLFQLATDIVGSGVTKWESNNKSGKS